MHRMEAKRMVLLINRPVLPIKLFDKRPIRPDHSINQIGIANVHSAVKIKTSIAAIETTKHMQTQFKKHNFYLPKILHADT